MARFVSSSVSRYKRPSLKFTDLIERLGVHETHQFVCAGFVSDFDDLVECEEVDFSSELDEIKRWNDECIRGGNDDLLRKSLYSGHSAYNKMKRYVH